MDSFPAKSPAYDPFPRAESYHVEKRPQSSSASVISATIWTRRHDTHTSPHAGSTASSIKDDTPTYAPDSPKAPSFFLLKMSSSSRQVDYTLVHPAPGHGKPLDWVPKEGDELYVGQPLPTALLQDSVTSVMFAGDDNVKKAL